MPELDETIAEFQGTGYIKAYAGFGKTYLIAKAVSHSARRQLILTHTYAGVNAIKKKLSELGVSHLFFQVDTIASWSLRLCLSYPRTSNWLIEHPETNDQWNDLYHSCSNLLDQDFIRRIILASYAGLYVDEYQDCSVSQHQLVMKLSRDLPCRILGDPLQGIFDFAHQDSINWAEDIENNFESLGELNIPYRWNNAGSPDLGTWLVEARENLENDIPIDLNEALPDEIRFVHIEDENDLSRIQGNTCRYIQTEGVETVIGIHKGEQRFKAKCHLLSKNLSGIYSSIEEVEGRDVVSFFRNLDNCQTNQDILLALIEVAQKCMNAVNASISAATRRGERTQIRANTRNPDLAMAANVVLENPDSISIRLFLLELKKQDQVRVTRSDLFNRILHVLNKQIINPDLSLNDALKTYQSEFRFKGRPVGHRKQIGTTLLVKGLEYDHAIVLEADTLSKKELYVALTRGSKSLTIISRNNALNPQQ